MAPWVLHVDMDQFIAAVEVLRHPELAGLPVIVGARGDPTERGVVSTASYEARAFGVRSGMPLRTAVRRCPDAVVLPVDKPAYDAASAVVMDTLRAVTGLPEELQRGIVPPTAEELESWHALDPGEHALADQGARPKDARAADEFYARTLAGAAVDVNGIVGGEPARQSGAAGSRREEEFHGA